MLSAISHFQGQRKIWQRKIGEEGIEWGRGRGEEEEWGKRGEEEEGEWGRGIEWGRGCVRIRGHRSVVIVLSLFSCPLILQITGHRISL